MRRYLILCCVAVLCFSLAHSEGTTCNALNALVEFKISSNAVQNLRSFQVLDDSNLLYLVHFEDRGEQPSDLVGEGSYVQKVDFNTRTALEKPVLFQATVDKLQKHGSSTLLGSNQTRIHSLSKIAAFKLPDGSSQRRSLVTFLRPVDTQNHRSEVLFYGLKVDPVGSALQPSSKEVFGYENPFVVNGTSDEPIFDETGEQTGTQPVNEESSTVSLTNNFQLSLSTFQDSVDANTLEFAVLILNQGSLKLLTYKAIVDDSSMVHSVVKSALVVPAVTPTVDTTLVYGGKMVTSNNAIYVTVPLNKAQLAAFNKYHKLSLQLLSTQEQLPVVIKFDRKTLEPLWAVNAATAVSEKAAALFHSGMALHENTLVLVGNTEQKEEGYAEKQSAFFVHITDTSNLTVVGGFIPNNLQANGKKPEPSTARFYASRVSFSLDGTKFLIGGSSRDSSKPYAYQGRLVLASLSDGTTFSAAYVMHVGEDGSSVVQFIRSGSKLMFLGMSMNGPTTAPTADSPVAHLDAGFWQLNCEQLSEKYQKLIIYGFFALFGISTFAFVLVVGVSLGNIIYGFVRQRVGYTQLSE